MLTAYIKFKITILFMQLNSEMTKYEYYCAAHLKIILPTFNNYINQSYYEI